MSSVMEQAPPSRTFSAAERGSPCVAFVTPHKATFLKPLYESFAKAQPEPWRTIIIWPGGHASEHPDELLTPVAHNLEIHRVPARKIGPKFVPDSALGHLLDSLNPRLVVIQEYSPFSIRALRFARSRKIPVVVITEVGRSNRRFFSLRTRLWHRWWSRFVDGIAAACPAAHEPLSGRKPPSIAIYHAVDARAYQPLPRHQGGPLIFAYLGQLIPRKGLDLWMEAARKMRDDGEDDFRLRVIGGGDESWLRDVIRRNGMEDKVDLRGFLSGAELREALGTADVFVLPTRQDTYAAVVHEAACLGLPLLVSHHAGAAQALVREGENGFVIDPFDTPAFAQRMRMFFDPGLRTRMSAASRAIGEKMSSHLRGAALWNWIQDCFLQSKTPAA